MHKNTLKKINKKIISTYYSSYLCISLPLSRLVYCSPIKGIVTFVVDLERKVQCSHTLDSWICSNLILRENYSCSACIVRISISRNFCYPETPLARS